MSKAYAFVAALACFLPAVVACSSSNDSGTSSGNKKDSGSDSGSSGDDDGDDDGTTEDAGDSDAGPACSASTHAAAVTSVSNGGGVFTIKSPKTCKTCVTANCPDICSLTDGASCAASNCSTECAYSTPDAGTPKDSGATEGGTDGTNCAKLKACCDALAPFATKGSPFEAVGTQCTAAEAANDDATCASGFSGISAKTGTAIPACM